jgi:hypothetical protein
MMRKGRGGDVEPLLQATDRHALFARPHQGAVDLQPGRIAQGFQAGGGIVELHGGNLGGVAGNVKRYFRNIRNKG